METENRKSIEKINETKSWLFEKMNKIDKPLVRLTKKKVKKHKLLTSEMKEGASLYSLWTLKG